MKNNKTIVIAGINSEIGKELTKILLKEGYSIIGFYQKDSEVDNYFNCEGITLKEIDYFDKNTLFNATSEIKDNLFGFVFMEIFFNLEDTFDFDYYKFEDSYKVNVFALNVLVRELVKKMNYESSIVIVNSIEAYRGSFAASAYASAQAAKVNLVQTYANVFTEMYGIRINSIMAGWIGGVMETDDTFNKAKDSIPMKRLGHPEEIADDIYLMLTRHKYTNGSSLVSDGGYLSVDAQSKTEDLDSGKFYKIIDKFFNETKKGTKIWVASMMLDTEWNDSPSEDKYIKINFDAVNRGVEMERIFIFEKDKSPRVKENKYIKMYLENKNITTRYVDLAKLKEKNEKLLSIIENGWVGIDEDALLVDLPSDDIARGYVTMNKSEIKKARECFEELKRLSVPLKEILIDK